jgi:hypothetical protein
MSVTRNVINGEASSGDGWLTYLQRYGLTVGLFALAVALTNAHFMGDSFYYVDSVVMFNETGEHRVLPQGVHYSFLEFGHLVWRPVGWLLLVLAGGAASFVVGEDARAQVTFIFLTVNWLTGLVSVITVQAIARRFSEREWIARVAAVALIFTNGFLNWTQSACSYVPGLMFLLLGFYILLRRDENISLRAGALAGAMLAAAVCLWFPLVWGVPAIALTPPVLFAINRQRIKVMLAALLSFSILTGAAYLIVIISLNINSIAELREWVTAAGHGLIQRNNFLRMLFGIPRSFLYLGDDAVIFKRYLVRDQYNPVTLAGIFQLSLWKLALTYVFFSALVVALWRTTLGKRLLLLFIAGAIPVIAFALLFQGSDMERYFALYPFIFASLAYCLDNVRAPKALKFIMGAFVAAIIITNVNAMAKVRLDRREEALAERIDALRSHLRPRSRVFVGKDELTTIARDFPFNPINSDPNFRLYSFLSLNLETTPQWRADFAGEAMRVWQQGGDVWVAKRLFASRPSAESTWVEGEDTRVPWRDLSTFFTQFETGADVGGEDGFRLLPPSERNRQILGEIAAQDRFTEGTR